MKKRYIVALTLVLVFSLLLPTAMAEERPSITLYTHDAQLWSGVEKDRVWLELENRAGVDVEWGGVAYGSYTDAYSVLMNTGDAPDVVFCIPGTDSASLNKWVEQGIVLPIDEYLTDDIAPNLKKLYSLPAYKNMTTNGKYIAIPRVIVSNSSGLGFYIRQDWLDNLGLDMPVTLDDYYDVMKAFTYDDPDGNGVDDTYGFAAMSSVYFSEVFLGAFVPKDGWNWNADKTKIEYANATENFKEFLKWMANAYNEGLVSQEFYAYDETALREEFTSGKAGMTMVNNLYSTQQLMDETLKANPNAVVVNCANPPLNDDGEGHFYGQSGIWGYFVISNNCKDPEAAMRFLDQLYSEEGMMLRTYGIEGVHYDLIDGNVVPNLDERDKEPANTWFVGADGRFSGSNVLGGYFGYEFHWNEEGTDINVSVDYSIAGEYADMVKESDLINSKYVSWPDTMNVGINDTDIIEKQSKIGNAADEYMTNALAGKVDIDATWDEYIENLRTLGLDDVSDYLTELMSGLN